MKYTGSLFTLLFVTSFSLMLNAQNKDMKAKSYQVVVNHEEQYSIIPADVMPEKTWKYTGQKGNLEACSKYIGEVWTDMRPLSIQKLGLPDNTKYVVVINHEEQYSVWPASMKPPKSWKKLEYSGNLKNCRNYISEVWTDMRPLSVRSKFE